MHPWWNSPILHYALEAVFFLTGGCMGVSVPAENWKTAGPGMRRMVIIGTVGAFVGALISARKLVYVVFFATPSPLPLG